MEDVILIIIIAVFLLLLIFISLVPVRLWITTRAAGVHIRMRSLAGMRLQKIPPEIILIPFIKAEKAGLNISVKDLESYYLAGCNIARCVDALILAHQAGIPMTIKNAMAIDISGGDTFEFASSLAEKQKTYSADEVVFAGKEYLNSLDQDMLKAKRLARR